MYLIKAVYCRKEQYLRILADNGDWIYYGKGWGNVPYMDNFNLYPPVARYLSSPRVIANEIIVSILN